MVKLEAGLASDQAALSAQALAEGLKGPQVGARIQAAQIDAIAQALA